MVYVRIEDLKKKAIENKIPIMQDGGIDFILKYIKENDVKKILEIGTAVGYSAIKFASINKDIKVTTIERDHERYNEARKNIQDFELNDQIDCILGDALETRISDKFDLIFIDAAKSQYIKFFEKYKYNLKPTGVIISDNLSFHGLVEDDSKTNNKNTKQLVKKIRKYIAFLKENTEFETNFISVGDGLSISKISKNTCNK